MASDAAVFSEPVDPDLEMVVVIPALAEPALLDTLDSLQACDLPACPVEIVVLINDGQQCDPAIPPRNQKLLEQCLARCPQPIKEHYVYCQALPERHAGVGLARKLGLDAALERLLESASADGLLVNLDADCRVASNYLTALHSHFRDDSEVVGASIYFEHNLDTADSPLAIAGYELHLRYFVHALRYSGMPFVFHTVGSCMAVRSDAYMNQGGMNRRQAGEDYYFVQKLAETGHFSDLTSTVVYPSSRHSWRVPFGTGRAMASWQGEEWLTYAPEIFDELAQWNQAIPSFFQWNVDRKDDWAVANLPDTMAAFLIEQKWPQRLPEIRANTASLESFVGRVQRWFNNFRAMKFVHFATAKRWPKIPVSSAAADLLARMDHTPPINGPSVTDLLTMYRQRCRQPFSGSA